MKMKQKLYTYTFTVSTPYFDDKMIIQRKLPDNCDMEAVIDDVAEEAATAFMLRPHGSLMYHELYSSFDILVHRETK